MKNIRRTIIMILTVIVVGVAAFAILMKVPQTVDSPGDSSKTSEILLYDKTSLDPEEITIKNADEEFRLIGFNYSEGSETGSVAAEESEGSDEVSSADGESSGEESDSESSLNLRTSTGFTPNDIKIHYTSQDYPDAVLDKGVTNILAYECAYVTALQIIDKSGERYAEYGLDKPRVTAEIIFSDNSVETLYIGNDAPDDMGVYLRRDKNANVYLVQKEAVNMLMKSQLEMIDKTITAEFESKNGTDEGTVMKSISVFGSNYKEPIELSDDTEDITSFGKYIMTSPRREICDYDDVQLFGKYFYGLEADSIAAGETSEKTMKKYGLDKPFMEIHIKADNDSNVYLRVSAKDENGNIYLMRKSGGTVYCITEENIDAWYGINYIDLLAPEVINPRIQNMTQLDLECQGKKYEYKVTNKKELNDVFEEVTSTEVKLDGKETDPSYFTIFVSNLSNMIRTERCSESYEGCELLLSAHMKFEAETGEDGGKTKKEKAEHTFSLYKTKEGKVIAVLDGMVEGYTSAEGVEELLPQAELLAKGKEIKNIYLTTTPPESSEEAS